jgi:type II secretory pathway pseudopilin PulG
MDRLFFRSLKKDNNNNGDTIVEVLLSITIIGLVLGAAYLLTNRSLQAGIAAREHTEALNFVQGQIERLKSAKESSSTIIFNAAYAVPGNDFCLVVDPTTKTVSKKSPATTDAACMVDAESSSNGRYHLSATYTKSSDLNPSTFRFSATWERIGGGTTESADIYYRFVQ